jgi:hypothetical protein
MNDAAASDAGADITRERWRLRRRLDHGGQYDFRWGLDRRFKVNIRMHQYTERTRRSRACATRGCEAGELRHGLRD